MNRYRVTVKCDQPAFEEFTCFDPVNIADLKTAIQKVSMSKKDKNEILKIFRRVKSLRRGDK